MLKITERSEANETTLRLEGRLASSSLAVFWNACADHESAPASLHFDLAGLRHLDADAARAIASWIRRGARASGASPFVNELLKEALR